MNDLRGNAVPDLFEHLPTAIHVYSFDEAKGSEKPRLVAANLAAERVLGPGSKGALLEEAFPRLRGAGIAELCKRVAASGESTSLGEISLNEGKDSALVLMVKAFPLGEGRVGVMFDDVRALKEAHAEELRLLRIACQAVIDIAPDPLYVKKADGQRFLLVNKIGAQALNLTPETFVGKRNEDLFPPDVAAMLTEIDERVTAGHEPVFFDEMIPLGDKGTRNFHTTKVPVHDKDGRPLFLAFIARDMSERKRAEEALAKSREELFSTRDNLLATIRELSTPVLPIHDGILVVPLVGHMDSQRSSQLTDALLSGIQRHQAETVILDITGVELVDTAVASHLIQATRAAALLGTQCVLVGIAPSIAQTLVQIGVDFGTLTTRRDLQAGVAYALAQKKEAM